jgi:hypothetical protein
MDKVDRKRLAIMLLIAASIITVINVIQQSL